MDPRSLLVGFLAGIGSIAVLLALFAIVRPWLRMYMRGAKGSLPYVLFMRLRGNPVMLIIDAYTSLLHSGVITTLREVESHYIANQSRILTSEDLVNSIRRNPVETHVAVWMDSDDAEWLGTHFSETAERLWKQSDSSEDEPDAQLAEQAERCSRIAQSADVAMVKINRANARS